MYHQELTAIGLSTLSRVRLVSELSIAHRLPRVPFLSEWIANAALRRNHDRVMSFNGSEAGATVFIIGSGPTLNALSRNQLLALADRPTIGVNRTQYAVDLKYFLSAYPAEVILALRRCGRRTNLIHLRPNFEPPLVRNTLTIRRVRHRQGQRLETSFTGPIPTLHTFKNIALAATHFALILGAARVVFVGVEQTSALHFYDVQPALRSRIIDDIQRIRAQAILTADHPYAAAEHLLEKLNTPAEELSAREFFVDSHEDRFTEFLAELKRHGTEAYTTTHDSVVATAGAQIVSMDEALAW